MADPIVRLYEGLFLLPQGAAADLGGAIENVRAILSRAQAEILLLSKWDERRLAYEINGQKRGTYLLAYFKVRGSQVANIERDCNLADDVLRVLILRADHIGDTELNLALGRQETTTDEAKLRSDAATDTARDAGETKGDESASSPAPEHAPAGAAKD